MTNQRRKVVATARSSTTRCDLAGVRVRIERGEGVDEEGRRAPGRPRWSTSSTTTDTVRTAEMDSKASRSLRLASRSTKTGMKVAERTPPSTTS